MKIFEQVSISTYNVQILFMIWCAKVMEHLMLQVFSYVNVGEK